jgi:dTDP-4-dehydrorhamnose 3,5-epimerase
MLFSECTVAGARLVEPEPRVDERGRFMRAWCQKEFASAGVRFVPLQANMGRSKRQGTLRGLHYQVAPAQAKLVRCTARSST